MLINRKICIAFAAIIIGLSSVSCKKETTFILSGEIAENIPEDPVSKVYLEVVQNNMFQVVDSAKIKNNRFSLKSNIVQEFGRLRFGEVASLSIYVDEEGLVLSDIDLTQPIVNYRIKKGSKANYEIQAFVSILRDFNAAGDSIIRLYQQAEEAKDSKRIVELEDLFQEMRDKAIQQTKALIDSFAPSVSVIYAASLLDIAEMEDARFLKDLAQRLTEAYPAETMPEPIKRFVGYMKDVTVGEHDIFSGPKVGEQAPDFNLPQPDGSLFSLSNLRGKYVLIDFWASWCAPCRRENPRVVAMYEKYKSKNFEILGVSLDDKREAWQQAIEKDKLTWKHVSDLRGWESEAARIYNVTAIPMTYLIDPNGVIIAKGLRGEELEKKLGELLP